MSDNKRPGHPLPDGQPWTPEELSVMTLAELGAVCRMLGIELPRRFLRNEDRAGLTLRILDTQELFREDDDS